MDLDSTIAALEQEALRVGFAPARSHACGYTGRPGSVDVAAHLRSAVASEPPAEPGAVGALRWLRERWGGCRFRWSDIPEALAPALREIIDRPVGGLCLYRAGWFAPGVRGYRVAFVTPASGKPGSGFLEAATDRGAVAWRDSATALVAWAAGVPGERLTIRQRTSRRVVGVWRREPGGDWKRGKYPAAEAARKLS